MHWIWSVVSLLTARTLIVRRPAVHDIFLTFDDGPHPEHTPRLLALLKQHAVRATFFLQGERVVAHGAIVRDIVADGHVIANHSYSHPWFNRSPLRVQIEEITRTERVLTAHDGKRSHLFRPPHGRAGMLTVLLCALRRQPIVLWNQDSHDYRLSSDEVLARVRSMRIVPGDVLLFHDDSAAGHAALEKLIPAWKASGLGFGVL